MAGDSYRVIPRGKNGFDVEMAKPDGRLKTVPGFRSEHEANAWIIQAQRMIRDAGPWTPLTPRKPIARTLDEPPPPPLVAPASSSAQTEQQRLQDSRNGAATRRASARATRERAAVKT